MEEQAAAVEHAVVTRSRSGVRGAAGEARERSTSATEMARRRAPHGDVGEYDEERGEEVCPDTAAHPDDSSEDDEEEDAVRKMTKVVQDTVSEMSRVTGRALEEVNQRVGQLSTAVSELQVQAATSSEAVAPSISEEAVPAGSADQTAALTQEVRALCQAMSQLAVDKEGRGDAGVALGPPAPPGGLGEGRVHGLEPTAKLKTNFKIPSFTGKTKWKVWINRFEMIAQTRGWSKEERLRELLPRLDDEAASFVFDELPTEIRESYDGLIQELGLRFRIVEDRFMYQDLFRKCQQDKDQSIEDYTARVKSLYDKAYPGRDREVRRQDLLAQFYQGLQRDIRFKAQEQLRGPGGESIQTVDEAANYAVHLLQVEKSRNEAADADRGGRRGVVRRAAEEEREEEGERVARAPPKRNSPKLIGSPGAVDPPTAAVQPALEGVLADMAQQLRQLVEQRPRALRCFKCGKEGHTATECPHPTSVCFACGGAGHFKRHCPSQAKAAPAQNRVGERKGGQGQN